ncbi:hypothetical protein DIPPA_04840 [Diplonema papillatum]|nr:hypothetical protein DIPPA_04840 [Diplonema papillatum]
MRHRANPESLESVVADSGNAKATALMSNISAAASYNVIGDALALTALCGCFVALVTAVFKFGTCVAWAGDLPISLTAMICGATVSVPVAGGCFLMQRLWQDIEQFEKDLLS